ncbi:MFS transporter [uncultured Litoreibacter sp.]|uniref:MFS transporter n=1 Tax=uncultured Litoreibacter sp. TaxID=1392394 RepID=UPI002608676B|nr:MFS transporter [uncultured Litoreibacter sp.]
MTDIPLKKRVRGWMAFDWASQPYNTLLLTFIFGPYFASIFSDRLVAEGADTESANAHAQAVWGFALAIAGALIALLAPVLGAVADSTGRRMPFIWTFSALYVIGAAGLWFAYPAEFNTTLVLGFFVIGLVGMEFATSFTNALLPELGDRDEIGKLSGTGWAIGYVGGLIALVFTLCILAENESGKTLIGLSPAFGLDAELREGTRSVGPFAALWYMVFMIPFFIWVRESGPRLKPSLAIVKHGMSDLVATLKRLPQTPSLMSYLGSSMLYRDALNGMYTFGGIYAVGVLGWSVVDVGVFGILAIIFGAIFAFVGGRLDSRYGPKPVIVTSILALILAAVGIVSISPMSVFGIMVPTDSLIGPLSTADVAFYLCGCVVGAAGGTVQAASRTMLVRQANPERMTEAFGLYALAGKATAFLAPALIGVVSAVSESQRIGVTPVIGLFLLGLILLLWVKPEGEDEEVWASAT